MKPKKWEILLVAALVIGLAVWALIPRDAGSSVTVTVDGEVLGSYALSENRSLPVDGYDGYRLTLVISGGKAHVEDSTCPDLICQNHAPISASGEQIICLPARVVITVDGEGVDAVAN